MGYDKNDSNILSEKKKSHVMQYTELEDNITIVVHKIGDNGITRLLGKETRSRHF